MCAQSFAALHSFYLNAEFAVQKKNNKSQGRVSGAPHSMNKQATV